MRNKWFEEQIAEFKTRSDNEVLEFLSSYWNITPDVKGVFTMVGTYKKADHKDKKEMILRTSKTFAIPKAIFCIIHLGLEK